MSRTHIGSAQYYVFNFAELHFSKFPTTSPYVQRVVADCRGGRLTEVFRLQSWLNRLKLDTDAEKWSSILDAIDYLDPSEHRPKPDMRVVIDALANICHSSEQAEAATPVLANLLAAEAGVCSENDLRAAFSSLGVLIDRTDKPERIKQDVSAKLSETVASMLFVGRAFCVQAASTTLGAAGQNILGKAVDHLLSKRSLAYETGSIQHAASPADMEALPEIMDQGLHALFEKPDRLRVKVLLPEALLFALKADCLGKLWVRLRPWLMSELLDTLPPTEAAELSRRIEAAVSGDKCPQAWLDLLRWQLCSTSVPKDVKTSIVTSLAAACRASSNPSIATKEALGEATKQLEGLNYLLLLEALVDKVDDEVSQIAEQAYNEFLVTIPEQDQWKLRRKMAGRNANLVNREFVRTVWPWSEEQGQETLDKWMHEIFERFPEVNNDVASKLTSLAVRAQDSDALTSLLSAYLRKATDGKIDRQGRGARAAIALALITVIPLDGMSPNLAQCLDNISLENWPPHEAVRFELMREMASVTQMYEAGRDLSFADLLKQRPLLLERIKSSYLESTQRRQAFGWAVQVALKGPGIVDLESSEALLDITFEPFDKG
ncbi:MAG: hypothetical protein NTV38_04300, partial [Chloroflexi bacterium]|nr:hypothetical protein [Chloroflexota bacterium]